MAKYPNRVQVNLSNTLRDRVNDKALSMGVTVPEYVRFVLLNDLEEIDEIDREILKDLPEAMEDVRMGRVIKADTIDEAIKIFDESHQDE